MSGQSGALTAALSVVLDRHLPDHPYVPGGNERPTRGIVFDIAARAGDGFDPANWQECEAWIAGVLLFQRGFFWEAHEVWEKVWMGLPHNSAAREFVQGVIQLANARLKIAMGQDRAAVRLEAIAQAHLAEAQARGNVPHAQVILIRLAGENSKI